jgi:hypothetical protein
MNPQDNLPGPDDYGFLDEWDNEAAKQFDPLAENPLDPLSNILDAAEQQIEGTTPIGPQPPDIPPDVFPDKPNEENDETPSDKGKDEDEADSQTPAPEGTTDIRLNWSGSDIRSKTPLSDIHHERGYQSRVPPSRFSHGRGGAGLGHSAGRNSVWCPKQQDYVNTEDCQDCGYYNEEEQDPDRRCTHPDQE